MTNVMSTNQLQKATDQIDNSFMSFSTAQRATQKENQAQVLGEQKAHRGSMPAEKFSDEYKGGIFSQTAEVDFHMNTPQKGLGEARQASETPAFEF